MVRIREPVVVRIPLGLDTRGLGQRRVIRPVVDQLHDLIVPAREGTLNVMRAASRASVQRVVQTSSSSAISCGRDDPNSHLFTEADWTDPDHKEEIRVMLRDIGVGPQL